MSLLVTYIRIVVPQREMPYLAEVSGIYTKSDNPMDAHNLIKAWNEKGQGSNRWVYRVVHIEPAEAPRQYAMIEDAGVIHCMANDRKFPHPSELNMDYDKAEAIIEELRRASVDLGKPIMTAVQAKKQVIDEAVTLDNIPPVGHIHALEGDPRGMTMVRTPLSPDPHEKALDAALEVLGIDGGSFDGDRFNEAVAALKGALE